MSENTLRLTLAAGQAEYDKGIALFEMGAVHPLAVSADTLRYSVAGQERQEVLLRADGDHHCTCEVFEKQRCCRHMVAAILYARKNGQMEKLKESCARLSASSLLDAMEGAMPSSSTIKLEFTLLLETRGRPVPETRLGIRLGEDRLYVARSVPQFLEAMKEGETLPFGKSFVYQPEWMRFSPLETTALSVVDALCQAQKAVGVVQHGPEGRTILLPDVFLKQLLSALSHIPFRLAVDGTVYYIRSVEEKEIPLTYNVNAGVRGITISTTLPPTLTPLTEDFSYVFLDGGILHLPREQQNIVRTLYRRQMDGQSSFEYSLKDAPRVIGEVVPFLGLTGVVDIDEQVRKKIVELPLRTRLYLDKDGPEVVARVVFAYGEYEIDPFDTEKEDRYHGVFLLRNAAEERRVIDELASSGFHVRKGRIYISGADDIFDFVNEGLGRLMGMTEVFASLDFKRLTPRRPQLAGSMKVGEHHLELTITENGVPVEELAGILEALSNRRKYFRLKDGSFLDLSGMDAWQETADMLNQAAASENADLVKMGGTITLQSYRTMYFSSMMEQLKLPITQDDSVKRTVSLLTNPQEDTQDQPLSGVLRPYQERGFAWLKALHQLHMGGILADDMGLGKTLQVISVVLWAKRKMTENMPVIVVSPTSLTYNWQAEFARFAPELKTLVMTGSQQKRQSQVEDLKKNQNVDVLITSYPLIRRDIQDLKDVSFRFAILDEAQHIKNMASVGAAAVKQLQAETRYALTGTPMENHAGELWSLFDFVLPGYLLSYTQFIRQHGDGRDFDKLQRKIRPFLMRRLKKEVLTELPDKLETTMVAQMPPEQMRVYQAAMLRLKDKVDDVLKTKGMGRGRTVVLAAITELRQICCHPKLVLSDYEGSSGKLDLLMDIVPGALESGHRILLFSQFTSMLKILKKSLETLGITTMYLDGDTPPSSRLKMTSDFNEGKGQVFLISLKAGGTGLNLTGADMVIHYDPWWNPAAEDQATDRAHRIGQTREVEVIRLITRGSIEEQVVELGKKKRAMFDRLITSGEEMPTKLTENDIRALFE